MGAKFAQEMEVRCVEWIDALICLLLMRWMARLQLYSRRVFACLAWCVAVYGDTLHGASMPQLSIQPSAEFGWHRIAGTAEASRVYTIHASSNLNDWRAIATLIDPSGLMPDTNASFAFLDPASDLLSGRFYRATASPLTSTNDWKNQANFPFEAFWANTTGHPPWIKFSVVLSDPFRVYYQHSRLYPFHYDFVVNRLEPFRGMDRSAFDAVSLHRSGQQVVLGALLFPPGIARREIGIQFVGLDPYPPEQVAEWFKLVRSTIVGAPETVLYIPTLEQQPAAESARAFFASNGIVVSSIDAWLEAGNQVYSPGWALGRLKLFAASEIRAAFNDGRLMSEDILLTDGVPAEVPIIAGIITLAPATPNAHVALLARSYGIPFVYLSDPVDREFVQSLLGHEIVLRARGAPGVQSVRIIDVEGTMPEGMRAELLSLKAPIGIEVTPKATYGGFSAPTRDLTPADIRFFGGKAANYGLLRRTVPTNSPDAIAFSFDLWDAFMDQTLPDSGTLRAEIDARLGAYRYPPHLPSLLTNLTAVRDLIRQTAQFSAAQQQAITNALAGFTNTRRIRFRSSTNVEDAQNFIGAGLYDSYSGCLADDLDEDTTGPSICEPDEEDERGVFRAIQRVYASFFNENAFIERLRLSVNESHVGMGVLAHYSFPDEIEMANGVATVTVTRGGTNVSLRASLNTQVGANSVTNPDGTSQPEVVIASRFLFGGTSLSLERRSSLVPLGAYVMNWQADYEALMELLYAVSRGYAEMYTNTSRFNLDFEFKKVQPDGRLELKQVREIPVPAATNVPAAFLINEPIAFEVLQGECSDVFALHRQKSRIQLQTGNVRLSETNRTFYGETRFEFLDGAEVRTISGPMASFANHFHRVESGRVVDGWRVPLGAGTREVQLITHGAAPQFVSSTDPIRVLSDFFVQLGEPGEFVCLVPEYRGIPDYPAWSGGEYVSTNGWSIVPEYWPRPGEAQIIKTITLLKWKQTRITGLTTVPIVLTNYYAQTFRPGHHNFEEDFIFEPRLDPGTTSEQLSELAARNIRLLHLHQVYREPGMRVWAHGLDGSITELK
jgi:hypothetical protein